MVTDLWQLSFCLCFFVNSAGLRNSPGGVCFRLKVEAPRFSDHKQSDVHYVGALVNVAVLKEGNEERLKVRCVTLHKSF